MLGLDDVGSSFVTSPSILGFRPVSFLRVALSVWWVTRVVLLLAFGQDQQLAGIVLFLPITALGAERQPPLRLAWVLRQRQLGAGVSTLPGAGVTGLGSC